MKKFLVLSFVAVLFLSLAACGGDNTDETTGAGTEAVTVASTDVEEITNAPGDEEVTTVAAGDVTAADAGTGDVEEGTVAGDDEVDYYSEDLYIGIGTATQLQPGQSWATKFTLTDGCSLAGIGIECPSWGSQDSPNGSLRLAVYRWVDADTAAGTSEKNVLKASYAATVATTPLGEELFEEYSDNATLMLYFDELGLDNGGTYLFVLTNPDEEDYHVGCKISDFNARDYYGETKYELPLDYDGYEPVYTTNEVVAFKNGAPAGAGYMCCYVEVLAPVGDAE